MLTMLADKWNNISKTIKRIIIPAHILSILGIASVFTGHTSWLWLLAIYPAWFLFGHIGVGLFIHRYYTHKSFKTYDWIARLGAYFGILSGPGSPVVYKVVHMGYHHAFSDTEKDPHTPNKGFWWAYWKWLNHKWQFKNIWLTKDVMKDPYIKFYHNHYYKIYWGSFLVLCLIDWRLAVFTISTATMMEFHINGMLNSFGHMKHKFSYQNYPGDNSQNVPWLNWLTLGLGLHNNHHGKPGQYCYAHKPGEFDISKWIVPLITKKETQ